MELLGASGFCRSRDRGDRLDHPLDGIQKKGTVGLVRHAHRPFVLLLSLLRAARTLANTCGILPMVLFAGFLWGVSGRGMELSNDSTFSF